MVEIRGYSGVKCLVAWKRMNEKKKMFLLYFNGLGENEVVFFFIARDICFRRAFRVFTTDEGY